MHEVSLVHALFDEADRSIVPHAAADVRRLTVRIGALAGVEATLFRTAFEACRDERGYRAAALVMEEEPALWACSACSAHIPAGGALRCRVCDGAARLLSGDALVLQRIELELSDV